MVTGFNTDVEHGGEVYHVQTEDKGKDNPVIETLIYKGGEILTSHRSSYADDVESGADEKTIAARIEKQHLETIAGIKAGRYDLKKPRPFGEGIISSKSFDEVVLDYLISLRAENGIALVMAETARFVEGDTALIDLQVCRASGGEGVSGAKVKVKMVSSADRSRTLAQGATGEGGRAKLSCALPRLSRGAAALIIEASAGGESTEVKVPIQKSAGRSAR